MWQEVAGVEGVASSVMLEGSRFWKVAGVWRGRAPASLSAALSTKLKEERLENMHPK